MVVMTGYHTDVKLFMSGFILLSGMCQRNLSTECKEKNRTERKKKLILF